MKNYINKGDIVIQLINRLETGENVEKIHAKIDSILKNLGIELDTRDSTYDDIDGRLCLRVHFNYGFDEIDEMELFEKKLTEAFKTLDMQFKTDNEKILYFSW